jgi:hypothetical protein
VANAPDDPVAPGTGGSGATGAEGGTTTQGGGGAAPECTGNSDCASLTDECNEGQCSGGFCEAAPLAVDTPCGDQAEDECTGRDSCDGAGVCQRNDALNGTPCIACPAGPGQCNGCLDGACPDCTEFATKQSFVRPSATLGWELTGDWRIYQEAPHNMISLAPVDFDGLVFGTDGNRSQPYPGGEVETSTARTPTFILPAQLNFRSWNVDEGGGGYDTKRISVSIDGGMGWTALVDCSMGAAVAPFCNSVGDGRAPDAWDDITIPIPLAMIGQPGIIEFFYDTGDNCCDFERGWFLDDLDFATTCACQGDSDCGWATDTCGAGSCGPSKECVLMPTAADTMCGDQAVDVTCDGPDSCDGTGYCRDRVASNGVQCFDCMGGVDECNDCAAGACLVCNNFEVANTFDTSTHIQGWQLTGGWNRYFSAPVSQTYTTAVNFGNAWFGTDGNRVQPYPGNEDEDSSAITTSFVVPNSITFQSWHVDEGGVFGVDKKTISLSTDGGMTWMPIVDCEIAAMDAYPFCVSFNQNRLATQFDNIMIDTSAFAGQVAMMRFTYDTVDTCCTFERGWFINNLNVLRRCLDP